MLLRGHIGQSAAFSVERPRCSWQWDTQLCLFVIKGNKEINTIPSLRPLLFHSSVVSSFFLLSFAYFLTLFSPHLLDGMFQYLKFIASWPINF